MNIYCTTIKAIKPSTGELVNWVGPNVPGISFKDAQDYCENNGLGYCKVDGLLASEVPCKEGTLEPDWDKEVDYSKIKLN